ncbi:MAG: hypothetical protein COA65_05765 [Rhodospirillaceae bacterium]|nr:MAG: hypothetical protein COA65_05765 [Rhodospirillaceae bacterium]
MQDRPTTSELLKAARDAFVQDLLPEITGEKRYVALMVANALAILGRDLESDAAFLQKEYKRLQGLLDVSLSETEDLGGLRAKVETLNRQLVAQIRAGAFDEPEAACARLRTHLHATTAEKLATSNPKALRKQNDVRRPWR